MKKRKLKFFVMPVVYGMMCATIFLTLLVFYKNKDEESIDNYTYVNSSIISKSIPTISDTAVNTTVVKPYISEKVSIYKKYYDKSSTDEDRENSILFYNNTYVQNTGILYTSPEKFDIISILDGTVLEVKEDETLGRVVSVKHENNIISTYYGLSEVKVKKDQKIKQSDVIGSSGKINIDGLENSLLIEIMKDSKLVNPESYYNKNINEL